MTKVFISYSSHDDASVRLLASDLEHAHQQVWMDKNLAGGESWWAEILEQIRNCTVFIFAVSDFSLRSKPCGAELAYAEALGLPILPVQVGEVSTYRTDAIFTKQVVDYREQSRYSAIALISALHEHAARRVDLPSPLPTPPPVPYEYLLRFGPMIRGVASLDSATQASALLRLRTALGEEQDVGVLHDIRELLGTLRARPDADPSIAGQIDQIVGPRPETLAFMAKSRSRRRWLLTAAIAVIISALIAGFLIWGRPTQKIAPTNSVTVSEMASGVVVGSPEAPKTIDFFNEPLCPACGRTVRTYLTAVEELINEKKIAVRFHLLNFLDKNSASGDYSTRAVAANYCVADHQDPALYIGFYEAIFATEFQPQESAKTDRTNSELADLARKLGAPPSVVTCIESGAKLDVAKSKAKVGSDRLSERLNGTVSTPSVFDGDVPVDVNDPNWVKSLRSGP